MAGYEIRLPQRTNATLGGLRQLRCARWVCVLMEATLMARSEIVDEGFEIEMFTYSTTCN